MRRAAVHVLELAREKGRVQAADAPADLGMRSGTLQADAEEGWSETQRNVYVAHAGSDHNGPADGKQYLPSIFLIDQRGNDIVTAGPGQAIS